MKFEIDTKQHSGSLVKFLLAIIAFSCLSIAVEIIPISRQAVNWNKCLVKTINWLETLPDFKKKDKDTIRAISVGICNGSSK